MPKFHDPFQRQLEKEKKGGGEGQEMGPGRGTVKGTPVVIKQELARSERADMLEAVEAPFESPFEETPDPTPFEEPKVDEFGIGQGV